MGLLRDVSSRRVYWGIVSAAEDATTWATGVNILASLIFNLLTLFPSYQIPSGACKYIQRDRAKLGKNKAWIWEPKDIYYWTSIDCSKGLSYKGCSNVCCTGFWSGILGMHLGKVSRESSICMFLAVGITFINIMVSSPTSGPLKF